MADMYGRVTIGQRGRSGNGNPVQAAMTSDGALVQIPWLFALSLEGLVFSTEFGAADQEDSDPGTFGPGAVVFTEIDMLVTTPSSGALQVIPIYWHAIFDAIGTAAPVDAILLAGVGAVIGANSITPTLTNSHQGSANTTACTIAALGDAGGTAPTTITQFLYRRGGVHLTCVAGTPETIDPVFSVNETGWLTILSGASKQVAAFSGSQAGTGFYHYAQVELPANSV